MLRIDVLQLWENQIVAYVKPEKYFWEILKRIAKMFMPFALHFIRKKQFTVYSLFEFKRN